MTPDLDHIRQVMDEADCLYTESEVEAAIDRMAEAITDKLADSNPLVYTVMNGGLVLAGKLLTKLKFPLESSYIHATRYRNEVTGGELFWKVAPTEVIEGRTILILDDILDEGYTLQAIADYCNEHKAKAVYTAVLTDKMHDRKASPDLKGDFVGLEIEDRFIFGYGMDYQGYWRNAPGIYALKGH